MVDKLREARQTYELVEAGRALEAGQQATLNAQREGQAQLAEFRKHVAETCGITLAERGRLRSKAWYVGRSFRRPFLWGFLLVALGGFIGRVSHHLAGELADLAVCAIFLHTKS